jgi:subfamily B ATP-binding cassette protein MsbA
MAKKVQPKINPGMTTYKRLLRYVARYWVVILISFIGNAIYAISNPLAAKWLGWFIDIYGKHEGVVLYGLSLAQLVPLTIIGVFLIRGIGIFLSDYYMAVAARNIVNDLRCEMFAKLVKLPSKYFDKNNSGHIISKVTYNVEQISSAGAGSVETIVRESLTVIALLAAMLSSNWKLAVVFLLCAPFCGIVIMFTNKLFIRYSRRIQSSVGDVTQILSESISGQRVTKVFTGDEYEKARFFKISLYNCAQGLKLASVGALSTPIIQMITAISMAFIVWLLLDYFPPMTPGEITTFLTNTSLLSKPLRHLVEITGTVQKGLTAAQTIFEFVDEESEKDTGNLKIGRANGLVEFKNVSFSYNDNSEELVISDLSFTALPGQTIAIVGRSGGGKSTLVSLIPRFYDYTRGNIYLDGVAITDYQLNNLRNQIALVTQNVTLFNDTIANNIAYGALRGASESDIILAATKAHAIEFIKDLPEGLNTLVGDNGVLLSGGQRQRLAIARAILKDAPILILDEATSALDSESEHFIQEALSEVMQGRTTFVIAHRLSTVEKSDVILVIDQGSIIEMGSHRDLLIKNGLYSQLHKMQFKDDALIEV